MKLRNIFSVAVIALGTLVTSCSEDGYWTAYEPEESNACVSFEGPSYSFSYASTDVPEVLNIKIRRSNIGGELVVPINFSTTSEELTAADKVTFAAGASEADYQISVKKGIGAGTYKAKIELADSTWLAFTGRFETSISLKVQYNWNKWATGDFLDNWLGVVNGDVEIYKAEGAQVYRIMKPFYAATFSAWCEEEVPVEDIVGNTCDYIEFKIDDEGFVSYDKFLFAPYNDEASVYGYYPSDYSAAKGEEFNSKNVVLNDTQIQFVPIMYVPGVGSFGAKQFILDIEKSGLTF